MDKTVEEAAPLTQGLMLRGRVATPPGAPAIARQLTHIKRPVVEIDEDGACSR